MMIIIIIMQSCACRVVTQHQVRDAGSRVGWRTEALQQPGIFCSVQLCASWHRCHRGMSLFPLRVSPVRMNFPRGAQKSQFTPTLHISSRISAAPVIFTFFFFFNHHKSSGDDVTAAVIPAPPPVPSSSSSAPSPSH